MIWIIISDCVVKKYDWKNENQVVEISDLFVEHILHDTMKLSFLKDNRICWCKFSWKQMLNVNWLQAFEIILT